MMLCALEPGQSAAITGLSAVGAERRRLRELGMTDGTQIECVLSRKGIDAYLIKGTVIALRRCDSSEVLVTRPAVRLCEGRSCAAWL